jgi:peptidoglycan hydrolase-like protein with peptidoglycan-binding domain
MTPEFLASLQRALQARGIFRGAVTGAMDAPTQKAVRAYQQSLGLDLPVLTLAAAQSLGLVPVARADL